MNLEVPKNYSVENESKNIDILSASPEDIQGILLVQKENLLSLTEKKPERLEKKRLEKKGFLIHEVSAEELNKLISDKENSLVLVAKEGDEIRGYVLSYDLELWKSIKPQWEETVKISESKRKFLNEEKILYLRHIAREAKAKGTGAKLMRALINEARLRKYYAIIAEILEKPITNQVSIEFHKRFGFEEIGKVEEGNNLTWGLFLKNLKEAAAKEQNP